MLSYTNLIIATFIAVSNSNLYPYGVEAGDLESPRVDDSCAVNYRITFPMFNQQLQPVYVSDV